jgi:hypothetical protein
VLEDKAVEFTIRIAEEDEIQGAEGAGGGHATPKRNRMLGA